MASLYVFLGMVTFWSIVLTLTFRLERRLVWAFSDLQPEAPYPDSSDYSATQINLATQAGFKFLGWASDLKGAKYRVSYAMLVSPERDVFAIVGVGAIVKIPVAATSLITAASNGRIYYSTDRQSGVQIDLTHYSTNQLAPGTNFRELLEQHRKWVGKNQIVPRPFTAGREVDELRSLRRQQYHGMEQAGLIGYIDASAQSFRYTLSGAARTAIWGYFTGMTRALSQGRFPRNV